MNAMTLLLPNLNMTALAGPMVILFGVFMLFLSRFTPKLKGIRDKVLIVGWLLIFAGAVYWVLVSVLQDIFSDKRILAVAITITALILVGLAIFWPQKKKKK